MDDGLQSIKTYLHNAALRQGMSHQTHVTALADEILLVCALALKPHCQTLEPILTVPHWDSSRRSKNAWVKRGISGKAKWSHGMVKLKRPCGKSACGDNVTDLKKRSKLKELQDYSRTTGNI